MTLQHIEFYIHNITRISLDNVGNHKKHYHINRLMCLKFNIFHIHHKVRRFYRITGYYVE